MRFFTSAPIVYRLGRQVLILEIGVRFPVGVPKHTNHLIMFREYAVSNDFVESIRIDVWLTSQTGMTRSRIKALIDTGHIFCGDAVVPNASHRVKAGAVYRIEETEASPVGLVAQPMDLSILYEDAAMIVLVKPAGLVVHPAVGHPDGTLVNGLLAHCPAMFAIGGEQRPGIVHRLDQDTSGVMVVAKTDAAMATLRESFQDHTVKKTYLTLVHGIPDPPQGRLENLIGRHPVHRQRMAIVQKEGRIAVTHYTVEETFQDVAFVRVTIETGRTHQIRVHMRSIGCPVLGDRVYGHPAEDAQLPCIPQRQMLHAWRLELPHPESGQRFCFEAPPPDDFQAVLAALRARTH